MCYNNCQYESYNPVTGDSHCRRRSNPCPMELSYCEKCSVEVTDEEAWESINVTDGYYQLCPSCLAVHVEKEGSNE
jgi:hypothetical protein